MVHANSVVIRRTRTVPTEKNGEVRARSGDDYSWDASKGEPDSKNGKVQVRTAVVVVTTVIVALYWAGYTKEKAPRRGGIRISSTEHHFGNAAVASDATKCSEIGREVLLDMGGSAVDAAIASLFCMGAASLHSMGIGGGFIATMYDRQSKQVSVIDARETAPERSYKDMFVDDPDGCLSGGRAIGVPGEVMGYWAMHQRYGRLPWSDLLQPAIDLCEGGFLAPIALQRAFSGLIAKNRTSEEIRPIMYRNETGELKKKGDVIRLPTLAETLRVLAREGGTTFYNGSLAKQVIEDIREKGGILTERDLREYKAIWRKPLTFTLTDGSTLYTPPAPGGGAVLTLILNILKGYDFNEDSISTLNNTVLTYHRMIEAMKFAYAQRTFLGDPDFVDVRELEEKMISPEFGDDLRAKIDDTRTFGTEYYGDTPYREVKPGTAHLSLIDSDGNAVTVTSSVNQYCGSLVVGRQTGIIFNNAMDDFSTPNLINRHGVAPFPTNYIRPGKRSLSSMSPLVVINPDSSVQLVTGAAGGSKISSILAQIILRIQNFGQSLGEATDAPRLHHQLLPAAVHIELDRFQEAILDGLKAKGHEFTIMQTRGTVVQSVLMDGPEVVAVSDNRKGGEADGY